MTVTDTGMGEGSGTLLSNKSYNLDDDPTTLSTATDTGMGGGSGTYYDHYSQTIHLVLLNTFTLRL